MQCDLKKDLNNGDLSKKVTTFAWLLILILRNEGIDLY